MNSLIKHILISYYRFQLMNLEIMYNLTNDVEEIAAICERGGYYENKIKELESKK